MHLKKFFIQYRQCRVNPHIPVTGGDPAELYMGFLLIKKFPLHTESCCVIRLVPLHLKGENPDEIGRRILSPNNKNCQSFWHAIKLQILSAPRRNAGLFLYFLICPLHRKGVAERSEDWEFLFPLLSPQPLTPINRGTPTALRHKPIRFTTLCVGAKSPSLLGEGARSLLSYAEGGWGYKWDLGWAYWLEISKIKKKTCSPRTSLFQKSIFLILV